MQEFGKTSGVNHFSWLICYILMAYVFRPGVFVLVYSMTQVENILYGIE